MKKYKFLSLLVVLGTVVCIPFYSINSSTEVESVSAETQSLNSPQQNQGTTPFDPNTMAYANVFYYGATKDGRMPLNVECYSNLDLNPNYSSQWPGTVQLQASYSTLWSNHTFSSVGVSDQFPPAWNACLNGKLATNGSAPGSTEAYYLRADIPQTFNIKFNLKDPGGLFTMSSPQIANTTTYQVTGPGIKAAPNVFLNDSDPSNLIIEVSFNYYMPTFIPTTTDYFHFNLTKYDKDFSDGELFWGSSARENYFVQVVNTTTYAIPNATSEYEAYGSGYTMLESGGSFVTGVGGYRPASFTVSGIRAGNTYTVWVNSSSSNFATHVDGQQGAGGWFYNSVQLDYINYIHEVEIVPINESSYPSTNSFQINWAWQASASDTTEPPYNQNLYYLINPVSGNGTQQISGWTSNSSETGFERIENQLVHGTTYEVYLSTDAFTLADVGNGKVTAPTSYTTTNALTSLPTNPSSATNTTATYVIEWNDNVNSTNIYYQVYETSDPSKTIVYSNSTTGFSGATLLINSLKPNTGYTIEATSSLLGASETNPSNWVSSTFYTIEGLIAVNNDSITQTGASFTFQVSGTDNSTVTAKVVELDSNGNETSTVIPLDSLGWKLSDSLWTIPDDTLKKGTSYKLYVSDNYATGQDWSTITDYVTTTFTTDTGLTSLAVPEDGITASDARLEYGWPSGNKVPIYVQIKDANGVDYMGEIGQFTPLADGSGTESIMISDIFSKPLQASSLYTVSMSTDMAFGAASTYTAQFTTKSYLNDVVVTPGITDATFTYSTSSTSNQTIYYQIIDSQGVPVSDANGVPIEAELFAIPNDSSTIQIDSSFMLKPGQEYTIQFSDISGNYATNLSRTFTTYSGISNPVVTNTTSNTITIRYDWNAPDSYKNSNNPIYYELDPTDNDNESTISGSFTPTADNTYTFTDSLIKTNEVYNLTLSMTPTGVNYAPIPPITVSTQKGINSVSLDETTSTSATFSYLYDLPTAGKVYYSVETTPDGINDGISEGSFDTAVTNSLQSYTLSGLQTQTQYEIFFSMYSDMTNDLGPINFQTLANENLVITSIDTTINTATVNYYWKIENAPIPLSGFYDVKDENGVSIFPSPKEFDFSAGTVNISSLSSETQYKFYVYDDGGNVIASQTFTTKSRISNPTFESGASSITITYDWDNTNNPSFDIPKYSIDNGLTWVNMSETPPTTGQHQYVIEGLTLSTQYTIMFSSSNSTKVLHNKEVTTTKNDYVWFENESKDNTYYYWNDSEEESNILTINFYLDAGFADYAANGLWFYASSSKTLPSSPEIGKAPDPARVTNQWIDLTSSALPSSMTLNGGMGLIVGGYNTLMIIDSELDRNLNNYLMLTSYNAYDETNSQFATLMSSSNSEFPTTLVVITSVLSVTIIGGGAYVIYIQTRKSKILNGKVSSSNTKRVGVK